MLSPERGPVPWAAEDSSHRVHPSLWSVGLSLRITMNAKGGQCLDRAGNRVRRWTWPSSTASSGPCAPLSPIFLSLNLHVGVRIMGQDKITVSFLAMGQQAKFNVGTKVQVFLTCTASCKQSSQGIFLTRGGAPALPQPWSCFQSSSDALFSPRAARLASCMPSPS